MSVLTIGILTNGRADLVSRCMLSFAALDGAAGRCQFLVFDAASDSAARNAVKDAIKQTNLNARYACERELTTYVGVLAQAGVSEHVARGLLAPGYALGTPFGAFKNALLLETVGKQVLLVSDDTLCKVVTHPAPEQGLRFMSATFPTAPAVNDPTGIWFYATRQAALAGAADNDLLATFGQWLGKSTTECRAAYVPKVKGVVFPDKKIVAVDAGGAGSPGLPGNEYYYFNDVATVRRLATDATFPVTQHIVRVSPRMSLSVGPYISPRAVALDNSVVLPPFFPCDGFYGGWGGEDLWGALLLASGAGCIAHLPVAIVHDGPEEPWVGYALGVRDYAAGLVSSFSSSGIGALATYLAGLNAASSNARAAQILSRMQVCLDGYGVLEKAPVAQAAAAVKQARSSAWTDEVPAKWRSSVERFVSGLRVWSNIRTTAYELARLHQVITIEP